METPLSRRGLVSATALGLAGLGGVAAHGQGATPEASPVSGPRDMLDAIAGGGVVMQGDGEVAFSLMAWTFSGPDDMLHTGGALHIVDASDPERPIRFDSTGIEMVEPISAQTPHGRRIVGWGTLNGAGNYPFMLMVEDAGEPGSGADTLNLVAGEAALPFLEGEDNSGCECGGLGYNLRGNVAMGDITLMISDE